MSEETSDLRNEALEAAIAAAPDDPAGYLAYGEWLRAQGHPPDDLGDLADEPTISDLEWQHGFVRHAALTLPLTAALDRHAIARFFEHPSSRFVRSVKVMAFDDRKAFLRVLNHPRLAHVRELTLATIEKPATLFEAVVRSPILARIQVLDVSTMVLDAACLDVVIPSASGFAHLGALEVGEEASPGLVDRLRASVPGTSTQRYQARRATNEAAAVDARAALEVSLRALDAEMLTASPEEAANLAGYREVAVMLRDMAARVSAAKPGGVAAAIAPSEPGLTLDDLLSDVGRVFRERGYAQRAEDWWTNIADANASASDETLVSLARDFTDFERELEDEYNAALAPFAEQCKAVFEPLDDQARAAKWKTDRHIWTTTAVSEWRVRQFARVARSPFDIPLSEADRLALEKQGRELRNRAKVAALRGRDPYPRNAELEAAIAAAPDDVDNYVVYADWLQERGDPRGELIALQARRAAPERITDFLATRSAELLGDGAADPALREVDWHLGYVRYAWAEPPAVLRLLALPAGQLLRSLRLTAPAHPPAEVFAVLADDRLGHVRKVTLSSMKVSWEELFASPILARLASLDVSDVFLGNAGAELILAAAPRLGHLASIALNPLIVTEELRGRITAALAKVQWGAGPTWQEPLGRRELDDARALLDHARSTDPEPIPETREWLELLAFVVERADAAIADAERRATPFFHPTAGQALADIELALGRRNEDRNRER